MSLELKFRFVALFVAVLLISCIGIGHQLRENRDAIAFRVASPPSLAGLKWVLQSFLKFWPHSCNA